MVDDFCMRGVFVFPEKLKSFLKNESGATAIEYGLIVTGISIGVAATIILSGDAVQALFINIETSL